MHKLLYSHTMKYFTALKSRKIHVLTEQYPGEAVKGKMKDKL